MFALFDLSQKDTIRILLFDKSNQSEKVHKGRNRELLIVLDEFLKESDLSKEDIKGIAVIVGEGSFTNTRVAVTVANTFTFANKVPVLAVTPDEARNLPDLISKFSSAPRDQYISATYSGEPNVGGY